MMRTRARDRKVRAVILAAGRGERLQPITRTVPKPLVEVAGHPLVTYGLGLLRASGIEEVAINVHHLASRVMETLGDGSRYGMRIHYSIEETLLDTGGGIREAVSRFAEPCDGPVVVLNADVICEVPLEPLIDFHHERDALLTLVLRDDPRKEAYGTFGIDPDGRVQRFLGRGTSSGVVGEYMFASVQVLSARLIARMPKEGAFATMSELYPDLFLAGEPMFGFVYAGPWHTADTPRDLARAEDALRSEGLPSYMQTRPRGTK